MKKIIVLLIVLFVITGCAASSTASREVVETEALQASNGQIAIVNNQPVPDLGGYSLEREILIQTMIARNNAITTYSYMITMDGKVIEICESIGYPIPYSTQLSNPEQIVRMTYENAAVLPRAEPNGLYPPGDAAATIIACASGDGKITPVYIEWYVMAFPYRITSDYALVRETESSFEVDIK